MTSALINTSVYLVEVLFSLYILLIMLRIILQWAGAHFYNPISQVIIKLTNPVFIPLRRVVPSWRGINIAGLIILVVLEWLKLILIIWLKTGGFANLGGLIIWVIADLLNMLINLYFWCIIIVIILSWLGQAVYNPIIETLHLITEPLLRPARRYVPPIAGFDLSPLIVIIALKALDILLVDSLLQMGLSLTMAYK